MPPDQLLLVPDGPMEPEDLSVELGVPVDLVEHARWHLPHHQRVSDMSWFVMPEDLPAWEEWASAVRGRVAAA
jgi:hypothetical protein